MSFQTLIRSTIVGVVIIIPLFLIFRRNKNDHGSFDKINVRHLQNDFLILRKSLEEAHPGLYWYTSKEEMDRSFDSGRSLITSKMSDIDFFKLITPLIAKIKCVHTNIFPSKETAKISFDSIKCFAANVKFIGRKAYISEDFSKGSIPGGIEILSINQVPLQTIVGKMFSLLPADGYNETYKYRFLENPGGFSKELAVFFGQPPIFFIEAFDPETHQKINIRVPSYYKKLIADIILKKYNIKNSKPAFNLEIINNRKTAILTILTFEPKAGIHVYRKFLQNTFKELKIRNVRHLIIDLRNNGGGTNSNVADLFAYLTDKPFKHLEYAEMIAQKFTWLKYAENPSDFDNLRGVKTNAGTFLVNYRYPGTNFRSPVKEYGFNGDVYLLANGGTVSAASEFVAIAKFHKRAVVIGEETGGGYYGGTGGLYLKLILPTSKIKVRIPTIRIFTAVSGTDTTKQPAGRGVIPDYQVEPTIRQWLKSDDAELNVALELITKKSGAY